MALTGWQDPLPPAAAAAREQAALERESDWCHEAYSPAASRRGAAAGKARFPVAVQLCLACDQHLGADQAVEAGQQRAWLREQACAGETAAWLLKRLHGHFHTAVTPANMSWRSCRSETAAIEHQLGAVVPGASARRALHAGLLWVRNSLDELCSRVNCSRLCFICCAAEAPTQRLITASEISMAAPQQAFRNFRHTLAISYNAL